MSKEELKNKLAATFPFAELDETGEFLNATIPSAEFKKTMQHLFSDADYLFDYMFCLTCVDWKTHLTMVYHLLSKKHKHELVIKVKLEDRNEPAIDTVCDIWRTAEFHEREVYDLFGVKFNHHPDLRRIFLDENWKGFPLRKDYEDPNMIEL